MKLYFIGYKGKGLISRMIKWRTNGIYSHVGEVIEDEPSPEKILKECSAYEKLGKVGYTDKTWHKKGTPYDVYSLEVSEFQYKVFKAAKSKLIGKKYDYLGILGFLFNKSKLNKGQKWFCSEAETYCLEESGANVFNEMVARPEFMSPQDFFIPGVFQFEFSGVS